MSIYIYIFTMALTTYLIRMLPLTIFRKPIKKEVEQMVNTVGILILFALMIFITFKDIFTLFI